MELHKSQHSVVSLVRKHHAATWIQSMRRLLAYMRFKRYQAAPRWYHTLQNVPKLKCRIGSGRSWQVVDDYTQSHRVDESIIEEAITSEEVTNYSGLCGA